MWQNVRTQVAEKPHVRSDSGVVCLGEVSLILNLNLFRTKSRILSPPLQYIIFVSSSHSCKRKYLKHKIRGRNLGKSHWFHEKLSGLINILITSSYMDWQDIRRESWSGMTMEMLSGAKAAFRIHPFCWNTQLDHYRGMPVPKKTTMSSGHSIMLVDPESLRKMYRFSECPRKQSGNVLTSAWKRRWLDKAGSEDVPSMSRICQRLIPVYDDSWWKKTHGSAERPSNKLIWYVWIPLLCS